MSRLSNFSSWEIPEKRKLISQLMIDAVTNDNLSLAYALLGPRISQEEEETLSRSQRESNENEKRMYPEAIRQRLFLTQLEAIDNYSISTRYQDITIQGCATAVEQASINCRKELILTYLDRLKAQFDISSEEAGERSELRAYIETLDAIFKDNTFELDRVDHLTDFKRGIKEKLALAEKREDALKAQSNVSLAMKSEALQLEFDERRAHHQSAIELAYGLPERSQWKLHDPTLRDMTFEEFKVLASYNINQTDPALRVTVDNCLTIEGNSLLHLAFYNRFDEIARFLTEGYGADLTKKNLKGQTPQQYAGIDSREDAFLQLVLSRDKKRPLSDFLQSVQRHLEEYKRTVLDANFLYRLFHHLFINVSRKHARRVSEHGELQQALEQARGSYHDDDVAALALKLIATSPRPEGNLLGGLQKLILDREAERLVSPRRVLQRIDSATAVQNTDLLDAYHRERAEKQAIIEQRDTIAERARQRESELLNVIDAKVTTIQGYELTVEARNATIAVQNELVLQLRDDNLSLQTTVREQATRLKQQEMLAQEQGQRLAKLEQAFEQLLKNQQQSGEDRRRSPGPGIF